MRIELKGGKCLITSDPLNYILSERKIYKEGKRAGEEYTEALGYYPTFEALVQDIVEREVRLIGATTLARLAQDLKSIKLMVREWMDQIKKEAC